MDTTSFNTILLEEEPAIFDATTIALNAKWVDWYMAKATAGPNEAVAKANEQLVEMVDHLTFLASVECSEPRYNASANQLIQTVRDIQCYQRCFNLLVEIQKDGWINRIQDSDPSPFATSGDSEGIRTWLRGVIRDEKLSIHHSTTLATFIITSIKRIDQAAFKLRFQSKVPKITSSVPQAPSLAWVLRYRFKHDVSLEEAHNAGVQELAGQSVSKA